MKPSVYYYQKLAEGHQLCLGECSTIEGLRLLEATREAEVTALEGSNPDGWLSKEQLPSLPTVAAVLAFLEASIELSLIDFEMSVTGVGSLDTHDDGECHFLFFSRQELLRVLSQATANAPSTLMECLLRSPGVYLTCTAEGLIDMYNNFDDYLASLKKGAPS